MSTCKDAEQAKKSTVFKKHVETIKKRMEQCVTIMESEQKDICAMLAKDMKSTYWAIKGHVNEYFDLWRLTNLIVKQLGV